MEGGLSRKGNLSSQIHPLRLLLLSKERKREGLCACDRLRVCVRPSDTRQAAVREQGFVVHDADGVDACLEVGGEVGRAVAEPHDRIPPLLAQTHDRVALEGDAGCVARVGPRGEDERHAAQADAIQPVASVGC